MTEPLIRRIVVVLTMAVWWGGFTFYSLVVVPTGNLILGDIEQGFVTRQVSKSINLLGAAALFVLLWNLRPTWRLAVRRTRYFLAGTWLVMLASQTLLFVLHPRLDALLDAGTREIAEPDWFHFLHEFYVSVIGVQWFAGLLHLVAVMALWPSEDRQG